MTAFGMEIGTRTLALIDPLNHEHGGRVDLTPCLPNGDIRRMADLVYAPSALRDRFFPVESVPIPDVRVTFAVGSVVHGGGELFLRRDLLLEKGLPRFDMEDPRRGVFMLTGLAPDTKRFDLSPYIDMSDIRITSDTMVDARTMAPGDITGLGVTLTFHPRWLKTKREQE